MKPLYLYVGPAPKPALFFGLALVVAAIIHLYWGFGPYGAFPVRLPGVRADRNNPILFWSIAAATVFVLVCAIAVMISASNALMASAS